MIRAERIINVECGWYAEWLLMLYGRELIILTRVWGRSDA